MVHYTLMMTKMSLQQRKKNQMMPKKDLIVFMIYIVKDVEMLEDTRYLLNSQLTMNKCSFIMIWQFWNIKMKMLQLMKPR